MTASRKNTIKEIRKKAIELHQKNGCPQDEVCHGPTEAEWEQATRAVLRDDKAAS